MAEDAHRPILNPVLRLLDEPTPRSTRGGGKSRDDIKIERVEEQQRVLSDGFTSMAHLAYSQPKFSNYVVLHADMFDDSFAPSYTPNDIFEPDHGILFTLPYKGGYLLQARADRLMEIAERIKNPSTYGEVVDISRIKDVRFFTRNDALGYRNLDELWGSASETEKGRSFIVHLMRLSTQDAVKSLIEKFQTLRRESVVESPRALSENSRSRAIAPLADSLETGELSDLLAEASSGDRIALALLQYSHNYSARSTMMISTMDKLNDLLVSGSVFRVDPSVSISVSVTESDASKLEFLPSDIKKYPSVGIVDGGLKPNMYEKALKWENPNKLVPDQYAAKEHGTQVASQIVHGYSCNSSLTVPELYCQIGVGQAISEDTAYGLPSYIVEQDEFISYLEDMIEIDSETKVWNFSFNIGKECYPDIVDSFSHDIAVIARKHNILPMISIGNGHGSMLRPPADCEAAITVGGRLSSDDGEPNGTCNISCSGPGPSGMLKPELSNFSHVRDASGQPIRGSSFAAALTSPLAAHTMVRLRDASPDIVKALLIHSADLKKFDPNLGFGTPTANALPWECEQGIATLIWKSKLRRGTPFDWEFSIPPSLLKTGNLKGHCAFTAILNPHPLISEEAGLNYFGVRAQAGFQVQRIDRGGTIKNHSLIETNKVMVTEQRLREQYYKWSPTKHSKRSFDIGLPYGYQDFRVHARIYIRDLYLFSRFRAEEIDSFELAFALSIGTGDKNDDVYSELVNILGNRVESAVLEPGFDIDAPSR